MAKRLISFKELDEIEGLVEHHRKLQERLEALEADAVQFDTPVQEAIELSQKADELRRDLAARLEQVLTRLKR